MSPPGATRRNPRALLPGVQVEHDQAICRDADDGVAAGRKVERPPLIDHAGGSHFHRSASAARNAIDPWLLIGIWDHPEVQPAAIGAPTRQAEQRYRRDQGDRAPTRELFHYQRAV